jgi:hypothetical protein
MRRMAHNPASFFEWALQNGYQKGFQLDRKDNNLGYARQLPLDNARREPAIAAFNLTAKT